MQLERELNKLKEIILGMRVPSKRKINSEIELEEYCSKRLKYTREDVLFFLSIFFNVIDKRLSQVLKSDKKTLYDILRRFVPEDFKGDFSSREKMQFVLVTLLDRVIQEER